MGTNNVIFLEVIEWLDESGKEVAHRIPEDGSGDIKFGAQLIVRESQAAVFFYKGKAVDAFGPGRHTLNTANIPIITKVLSAPWGFTSPLRAEVYFVNMKVFPNLKWGTKDPVAFKDSRLGLIRLRAFGVFNVRIVQPVLFVNTLVGTKGIYDIGDVEDYINQVIVSRLNDYLGENVDTIFDLPGKYDEFSTGLRQKLKEDLAHFGIGLTQLYINSITPPVEVQKAIDDKSRLEIFGDLDRLARMKAAMALEKAAGGDQNGSSSMGMGLGLMLPGMFADMFRPKGEGSSPADVKCPDCGRQVPHDSRFCPYCGHQQLVLSQCRFCGKNLPLNAQFCPRCGKIADIEPEGRKCGQCSFVNLAQSVFCNQCGERLVSK